MKAILLPLLLNVVFFNPEPNVNNVVNGEVAVGEIYWYPEDDGGVLAVRANVLEQSVLYSYKIPKLPAAMSTASRVVQLGWEEAPTMLYYPSMLSGDWAVHVTCRMSEERKSVCKFLYTNGETCADTVRCAIDQKNGSYMIAATVEDNSPFTGELTGEIFDGEQVLLRSPGFEKIGIRYRVSIKGKNLTTRQAVNFSTWLFNSVIPTLKV